MTQTDLFGPKRYWPTWQPDTFHLPGESITSIVELRAHVLLVRAKALGTGDGDTCPCCGHTVKIYKRAIHATMAETLIKIVLMYARDPAWIDLSQPKLFRCRDTTKFVYFHLLEPHPDAESLYRPTQFAVQFVMGVGEPPPKYAFVHNGSVLGYSPERADIQECLRDKFSPTDIDLSYEELARLIALDPRERQPDEVEMKPPRRRSRRREETRPEP